MSSSLWKSIASACRWQLSAPDGLCVPPTPGPPPVRIPAADPLSAHLTLKHKQLLWKKSAVLKKHTRRALPPFSPNRGMIFRADPATVPCPRTAPDSPVPKATTYREPSWRAANERTGWGVACPAPNDRPDSCTDSSGLFPLT
ncbi:hypothetical protein SKAU_G00422000 [Synaphobranchus kaupii]|uniref:Uncharacterized protein n=1 Tax=Synaphobranchus kaupii TaxID=118154 RepID=A0A9Q1E6R7_SYNKA|nr:hypothetical protein SKAU_G00422000 [Synaphobranchus kaupii]